MDKSNNSELLYRICKTLEADFGDIISYILEDC